MVNFDVPQAPDDYIHRVGRTARAGEVGDAFTFVAPDEQNDLRAIEKAIGKRLPQITIPDFDYNARPEGRLEIPIGERIAAIRGRKAEERARSKAKANRSGGSNGSGGHRGSNHSGGSNGAGDAGRSGGSARSGGSGGPRGQGGSSDSRRSGGPYRSRRGR